MRPTLILFSTIRSAIQLHSSGHKPFKVTVSTPYARHIVRAVLTSPAAHATPFGGFTVRELYEEILRQFPVDNLEKWSYESSEEDEKGGHGLHPINSMRCVFEWQIGSYVCHRWN